MGEWQEYSLGELADIGSSKRIFYKEYVDSGVPFYRSKEIIEKHKKKEVSTELHISEERYEEIKAKSGVPETGDILLTSVGTLGVPYVVGQNEKFYFKDGNLTWFKNINDITDSKFLYFWITSSVGKNVLDSITIGSTQPALTIAGLKKAKITLPPHGEQKAIAEVLSSLDDKIDLLQRQNQTLEALAETLFRHTFIDNAQDDWEDGTLGDIISISSGKGLKRAEYVDNGPYPVLGANGKIGLTDKYLFDETLIFTGRVGTLGNIFISNGKAWYSDNTLLIRPEHSRLFYYTYFLLKSSDLAGYNVGSTQPLIRQSDIKQIEILLPPEQALDEFTKTTKPLLSKLNKNLLQIKTLETLRDTLLPKLMSGDIRVQYGEAA